MTRHARASAYSPNGSRLWWRVKVSLPAAAQDWPVVLDFDEHRLVERIWANGVPLTGWDESVASRWSGGEGSIILPLTKAAPSSDIVIKSTLLPHLYENGFGQATLRPATLSEVIGITDNGGSTVSVFNHAPGATSVVIHARYEDYFGAELSAIDQPVNLGGNQQTKVSVPLPGGDWYKLRVWATTGNLSTLDHWRLNHGTRESRVRPEVVELQDGWERVSGKAPLAYSDVPTTGWARVNLPDEHDSPLDSSHGMWYRRTVTVPASWAGKKIQLYIPRALWKADVYVDGQPAGSKFNWELPAYFDLPPSINDGAPHTVVVGITDWVVGLRSDLTPAQRNTGRAMVAPVDGIKAGLATIPELVAVPVVRTDWAAITSTIEPSGKSISVKAEVQNDSPNTAQATLACEVFDRGKLALTLPAQTVTLAPGMTRVSLKLPWSNPKLWSPDTPDLYEMRFTLKSSANKVLDVRRERFGFRSFGYHDGHFTLNGKVFKMEGGSHVVLANLLWPVLPHAYRLIRIGMHHLPSAFMGGRIQDNIADEMGFLIKNEMSDHGATGQDRYAYNDPLMFERLYSEIYATYRTQPNYPSCVFWDVGNELAYPGAGEADRMGQLFKRIRAMDPTRLVTIGGSTVPTDPEVVDVHGWGEWSTRADYYFYHPEERPSYLKKEGGFWYRPASELPANWVTDSGFASSSDWLLRGSAVDPHGKLHEMGKKPILASEGYYYENEIPSDLTGQYAYAPVPNVLNEWTFGIAEHMLNMIAERKLALQNVRQGGVAGSMIHVDRGVGRWVSPLAAFSWDRKVRYESGETLSTVMGIHQDLYDTHVVNGLFQLWRGDTKIGEMAGQWTLASGDIQRVPLHMPLPAVTTDTTLRLHVEVWTEDGKGWFYDDQPITVFAPVKLVAPATARLCVFDPDGRTTAFLTARGAAFKSIARLDAWAGRDTGTLLVGSEGLNRVKPDALASLAKKIAAGGRVVLLDHRTLPTFLTKRLVQKVRGSTATAVIDPLSSLTQGLLNDDFRSWTNREGDQIVYWNPIITPSTGNFRSHLDANGASPLLELGEGAGEVLFCQLNMADALGVEPVATRVLANILTWTGKSSPFSLTPALLASSDKGFIDTMQGRFGLNCIVAPNPTTDQITASKLIILAGNDLTAQSGLMARKSEINAWLEKGGTLFVQDLDAISAEWLNRLIGSDLSVDEFPQSGAYLMRYDPLTAGLTSGGFFWGDISNLTHWVAQKRAVNQVGYVRVNGSQFDSPIQPPYLGQVHRGAGRVIVSQIRSASYPVPVATRTLAQILTNAGASMPGQIGRTRDESKDFTYTPIDLTTKVNLPFKDDPTGRRGWHGCGAENDMRIIPLGRQAFKGVTYDIIDPDKANGNGCIGLKCTYDLGSLPREVKGIPVNQIADRLYFLHASAWGLPGFTYRVYYAEDRKNWIPGKPDPYVDVTVKPGENIQDFWFARKVEQGEMFAPGCTVAWWGENIRSHSMDMGVGLYQMIWDNPHPEKTIESIDILSPGTVGTGEIFVVGITAAVRKGAGSALVPLSKVCPKTDPGQVFAHFQNANYGLVLLKSGVIAAIHDPDGNVLIDRAGSWYLQGMTRESASSPPNFHFRGYEDDQKVTISQTTNSAGAAVYSISHAISPYMDWSKTITCGVKSVQVEYKFAVLNDFPEGKSTSLLLGVHAVKEALNGKVTVANDSSCAVMPFTRGGGAVTFDSRLRNYGQPGYTFNDTSVNFGLFSEDGKAKGGKDSLTFEIELP
jgi:hypothetical protein